MIARGVLALALSLACRSPQPASYVERLPGTAVDFRMVWIPEGGFWIGATEVTWDEYLEYCRFDAPLSEDVDAVTRPSKPLDVYPHDRGWGTGRRPAVGMSKNAAEHYCAWLSERTGATYRLPSEAEWSTACGDAVPAPLEEHAWLASNAGGMTHEVATRSPSSHGVHDMLGNLWEYCADPYSVQEPARAVLRGGSHKDSAVRVSPGARAWASRPRGFWTTPSSRLEYGGYPTEITWASASCAPEAVHEIRGGIRDPIHSQTVPRGLAARCSGCRDSRRRGHRARTF